MNFAQIRAQISFNAIVVSIVILYGLFGAYVFRKFEAQNSASATNDQHEKFKEKLLKELWNHKNLEFDEWSTQVRGQLESYENNLVLETSSSAEWSLSDSWLFACTVFTTIGKNEFIISQFYFDSSRLNLSMLQLNSALSSIPLYVNVIFKFVFNIIWRSSDNPSPHAGKRKLN